MVHWFVRHSTGIEEGPFSEVQIRQGIESGSITEPSEVRQQQSGWFPVAHVRALFRRLADDGFYLKDRSGSVFGPFTKQRVLEFDRTNSLPAHYWIRQGKQKDWTEIKTMLPSPNATDNVATDNVSATETRIAPQDPQQTVLESKSPNPNGADKLTDELTDKLASETKQKHARKPNIPAAPVMKLRGNGLLGRLGFVNYRIDDAGDAVGSE